MSRQLKAPSSQWGADGEGGEPVQQASEVWVAGRKRAVVCGVSRWGREWVGQGGRALAVTHRATQLLGPDLGDPAQQEQGQWAG